MGHSRWNRLKQYETNQNVQKIPKRIEKRARYNFAFCCAKRMAAGFRSFATTKQPFLQGLQSLQFVWWAVRGCFVLTAEGPVHNKQKHCKTLQTSAVGRTRTCVIEPPSGTLDKIFIVTIVNSDCSMHADSVAYVPVRWKPPWYLKDFPSLTGPFNSSLCLWPSAK